MSLHYAILAALSERPKTGYELAKAIEGSIGHFWSATHQQIYKELDTLNDCGSVHFKVIKQKDKPDKKLYKITAPGLTELKGWIASVTPMPSHKSALLIKLFVGHLISPALLLKEFERVRAEKANELANYLKIEKQYFAKPNKLSKPFQFQYMTLRCGIYDVRAWLAWAEEVKIMISSP